MERQMRERQWRVRKKQSKQKERQGKQRERQGRDIMGKRVMLRAGGGQVEREAGIYSEGKLFIKHLYFAMMC